ncbi:MAG: flagellar basal body rod protein FlgB [Chloroflexi bacterium]|nr:flagellar basal body rod protein FlgB [Chloroflexota bacterium]
MKVFWNDATSVLLQEALTGLSLRQQVISNNLANISTPGFKASEVIFESELQRALEAQRGEVVALRVTHPAHISLTPQSALDVRPIVRERSGTTLRADRNNVDLEKEMATLAETAIRYQASALVLSRKLALLRSIIAGGRR